MDESDKRVQDEFDEICKIGQKRGFGNYPQYERDTYPSFAKWTPGDLPKSMVPAKKGTLFEFIDHKSDQDKTLNSDQFVPRKDPGQHIDADGNDGYFEELARPKHNTFKWE